KEICNLIFEPGFSTAEQVTNISGRGVGMDVVRRSIEALRGEIEMESEEGYGTTARIRLPLTLAIIDGFRVAVEQQSFVLPLDLVVECLEARPELFSDSPGFINLRDEVLPVVRLRELFQFRSKAPSRENVVVVQFGSTRAGLLVDRLEGELQAVIKPLGQLFKNAKGIGGSTILGTGEVSLILDVAQLVGIAMQKEKHQFSSSPLYTTH
ncbi:MAG TPA: chemotaxis protein CheW, partial [Pseudomonadales bacterium]|nr:chemotaxis protein CheW [Pseudomonadales bacterium]